MMAVAGSIIPPSMITVMPVMSPPKPHKPVPIPVRWETRFDDLVHFQKGYGHCRVPTRYKQNPGLASWVHHLRASYKDKQRKGDSYFGQLSAERCASLEAIGFEWTVNPPAVPWEHRYEELKVFKQENGHTRVRRMYKENLSLGEWCRRQRMLDDKGVLDPTRKQLLLDIGFELAMFERPSSWEEQFETLVEFRRVHGHTNVPLKDDSEEKEEEDGNTHSNHHGGTTISNGDEITVPKSTQNSTDEVKPVPAAIVVVDPLRHINKPNKEQAFRRWVHRQRTQYNNKWKKNIKCALDASRVKKLENIGFDFGAQMMVGTNGDRRRITGEAHHRTNNVSWTERLAQLVEYREKYGDTNVPKVWPENRKLGDWVASQRKHHKSLLAGEQTPLTQERKAALENVDFVWSLRPPRPRKSVGEKLPATTTTTTTGV